MHWMAVAMEASDGTTALARARQVVLPGEYADRPNRIAHYWLDLARAWLLHGNRDRCIDALVRARAISPEHVRYNPSLHETIATLAAQDARRTDSLTDSPAGQGSAPEPRGRSAGHRAEFDEV